MNKEKIRPLVAGVIKHIPGVKPIFFPLSTGGTDQSRYCYSIWLRHLINWNTVHKHMPEKVAELGPGDSLGIGLSALLTGVEQVHFLDVVKYWDAKRNTNVFEKLIELFKNRASIPDNTEYPEITPEMDNYAFPSNILTEEILTKSLADERLAAIKKEILNIDNPENKYIKCDIPWYSDDIVEAETIDFIYSQAVLEHVEDLENTYAAIKKWLKPKGLTSHSIDFRSHGITKSWNGHWTFGDFEWFIVKGGKSFLINREPYSKQLELHKKYGFKVLINKPVLKENNFNRNQLSDRFRNLSESDLTTSTTYLLAIKE